MTEMLQVNSYYFKFDLFFVLFRFVLIRAVDVFLWEFFGFLMFLGHDFQQKNRHMFIAMCVLYW